MIPKSNLAPLPSDWPVGIALQRAADEMLDRFGMASVLNVVCHAYGWLLYGPAPLPERLQPADADDTLFQVGSSFMWVAPGSMDGNREVLLITGDTPALYVRQSEYSPWQSIPCNLPSLCKVLDRWTDELAEVKP